ncbi:acyltransferase [Pedobacter alpinus]|uniref:Acyltransferase n=1 Tax=Pedobacter alpinus TaxID=1590643 RepID=A0ABW5TN48_9SPHI
MEQKQEWFNTLRVIATIAVITIHVSSNAILKHNTLPFSNWGFALVFSSISRFSVPIFFMLSGALLLQKDEGIHQFLSKRFLKIIPPLIFWSLVYIFYDAFIVAKKAFTITNFIALKWDELLNGSQYHLWFVYTLLGLYLFIPIIRKWVKQASIKELSYFLAIWLISFLFTIPSIKQFLPKIELSNFAGYLGYMVLGYFLMQIHIKKKYAAIFALLGLAVIIFGTYYLAITNHRLSKNYFVNNLNYPVFIYAVGVFMHFKNYEIQNQYLKGIINFINKYSFGIYLVHVLFIKILNTADINWKMAHPAISIPFTVLTCLVLSTLLVYLTGKITDIIRKQLS